MAKTNNFHVIIYLLKYMRLNTQTLTEKSNMFEQGMNCKHQQYIFPFSNILIFQDNFTRGQISFAAEGGADYQFNFSFPLLWIQISLNKVFLVKLRFLLGKIP